MAIRKFRKHIKPFIWFITILFIASSAMLAFINMRSSYSRVNVYAFKLNGNKVSKLDVEKAKAGLVQQYSRYLGDKIDRDLIDIIAFDEIINKNLTLEIADDLNVKISGSEVNTQYDNIVKSVGNKEQFKRMLAVQGYTSKTFKTEIKNSMAIEQTFKKIQDGINPDDTEIESYYNENKNSIFAGKTLSDVKEEIIKAIKEEKGMREYLTLLEKNKENAKIENVADEYKNLVETTEIEKDGFKITNVELAKKALTNLFITQGDKTKAMEEAKKQYESQIKLANEAISRGIVVDKNLPVDYQFGQYQEELFKNIKYSLNPSETELENYFKANSIKYDTFPSAQAKIAIVQIEPSAEDKQVAKVEAEKILKDLTSENFKDKAKELSQGPSASNGGELGWFSKGDMVEPFQKAAFEGKVGEVYPEPVETVFGYHLIFIEDRNDKEERAKASHILITPKVSKVTIDKKLEDIETLKTKLNNKEITFEQLSKDRKDIAQSQLFKINNAGYISGLGYNEELANVILNAPLNKIESINIKDKIYVFEKIEDVKYKKAEYKEVKDRVKEDYLNEKAQLEMQKYM